MDMNRPTEDFLRSIDIHGLLLQREPMVMIDTLTHYDGRSAVTETAVGADNIFVSEGRLTAAGLLEMIAQTCAARIGYVNIYILHKGVEPGLLAAMNGVEILALPCVGSRITTRVEIDCEVFGMLKVAAEARAGSKVLARGTVTMIKQPDEDT